MSTVNRTSSNSYKNPGFEVSLKCFLLKFEYFNTVSRKDCHLLHPGNNSLITNKLAKKEPVSENALFSKTEYNYVIVKRYATNWVFFPPLLDYYINKLVLLLFNWGTELVASTTFRYILNLLNLFGGCGGKNPRLDHVVQIVMTVVAVLAVQCDCFTTHM